MVVDTSANIFVADTGNNRVQKLDNTGAYASQFGTSGTADGQFAAPKGVAVDTLGNIYVADSNNNRIQKFTSAGVYSSKFGIIGGGNNQFIKPGGLAIDGSNLWVADTNNDRIIKSDTTFGTFTAWGSAGQGSGYFNEPGDVAFDDTGHAYVADSYNSLIQKFDLTFNPDGTLLNAAFASQWDGTESAGRDPAGQLYLPGRLLRDASGDILVADGGNSRIQKFDANGSFILEFGSAGSGDGQLATPCGLVLDADGNVFVADGGNPVSNDRVQKFTPVGAPGSVTAYNYASQFGTSGDGDGHDDPGQFDDPGGVVIDSRGFIYVVDTGNNRVQRFTSAGSFDFEWGGYGQGNGQFDYPRYIAIDGQDNIYVTDLQNDRVQKFTPVKTGETVTGYQYASQFGSTGNSEGKFNWPRGISFDPEGRVYVVDSHNDRIQVFLHMLDITTSAGTGGTITASTEVQEDKDKTITITPDTGYVVDDVLVDGSSVGAVTSYDFTNVQADHTISATFKVATFTLTPTAGENGSISPSTVVTVNYNGSQTFTMTPADGYEVADVLVDGSSVGAVTSYDFTGVVANHTISVTFQLQTFTITASAGTGGSISPEGRGQCQLGRGPGLHHNCGHGLQHRRRARGRIERRGCRQLHLQRRHRGPHHCCQLHPADLHHQHLDTRWPRHDNPRRDRELRRLLPRDHHPGLWLSGAGRARGRGKPGRDHRLHVHGHPGQPFDLGHLHPDHADHHGLGHPGEHGADLAFRFRPGGLRRLAVLHHHPEPRPSSDGRAGGHH